jgi:hypothetical protein
MVCDDSGQVRPFLYYTIYRMHVGHRFIYRVISKRLRTGEMSLQLAVGPVTHRVTGQRSTGSNSVVPRNGCAAGPSQNLFTTRKFRHVKCVARCMSWLAEFSYVMTTIVMLLSGHAEEVAELRTFCSRILLVWIDALGAQVRLHNLHLMRPMCARPCSMHTRIDRLQRCSLEYRRYADNSRGTHDIARSMQLTHVTQIKEMRTAYTGIMLSSSATDVVRMMLITCWWDWRTASHAATCRHTCRTAPPAANVAAGHLTLSVPVRDMLRRVA